MTNMFGQPQPLEELTVEQLPDDVEIEPDEHTDAFTVSLTSSVTLIHHDAFTRVSVSLKIDDRLSHDTQCLTLVAWLQKYFCVVTIVVYGEES